MTCLILADPICKYVFQTHRSRDLFDSIRFLSVFSLSFFFVFALLALSANSYRVCDAAAAFSDANAVEDEDTIGQNVPRFDIRFNAFRFAVQSSCC